MTKDKILYSFASLIAVLISDDLTSDQIKILATFFSLISVNLAALAGVDDG